LLFYFLFFTFYFDPWGTHGWQSPNFRIVSITGYGSYDKAVDGGDDNRFNVVKYSSGTIVENRGHAVIVAGLNYYPYPIYNRKETTAGPTDNLSYDGSVTPATFSGAWDF